MSFLRAFTCCWLTIFPVCSYAQELPAQTWYNYNAENGMPQNSSRAIAINRQGYLWIATEMGLARFDGKNFRVYNRSNTPVLQSDRMDNLDLQSNGQIYFLGENRNTVYSFSAAGRVIAQDSSPIVYRHNNGYIAFDSISQYPENEQLKPVFVRNSGEPYWLLPSGNERSGFFVSRNPNYVAYLKDYKTQWVIHNPHFNQQKSGWRIAWHNQFYATTNTWDTLMTIDTMGRKSFVQVSALLPGKKPFALQNFKQVFERNGHAYLESGKFLWELSWQSPTLLLAKPLLEVSSAGDFQQYLYEPSLNMHVFGTYAKGIFLAKQQQFRSIKNPAAPQNIYYAQVPYKDSGVFTNQYIFMPHQPVRNTPPYFHPRIIWRDRTGYYWGVEGDTLLKLDENFRIVQKIPRGRGGNLDGMRESPGGTLWFTLNGNTIREKKLWLGKLAGDSIHWVHAIDWPQGGLETFLPQSDSLFWIGYTAGLLKLDLAAKTIQNFPSLQGADVRRIYQDSKGFIWVGTYGSGFYVWNKQRFFKLPNDRKGFLNTAHAFLEDRKGFLWINTNKGLFQVKLQDVYDYTRDTTRSLYYHYYDKSDGLPSSEFNGGCTDPAIVLKDGTFSMSTMDGIVQFHPDSIRPLLPSNKIYIDEINVDSSPLDITNARIPASFNRLTLSVSSPYFGNPYNLQLEYNLAGLDDRWYPVNENNTIVFNKLRHGNYQLQLRKKGGFGVDHYITTRLPFTVQPGFFDTWTFKILALAGILLLFGLFVRFRTRYLVQRKNLLEQEVATRTRTQEQLIVTLQSTVDELTQSREELFYNNRLKEKLALLISHDLQSPLRFLSLFCDHLHELAAERNDAELLQGSAEIKNSSHEIHSFVEEFGLWATTQQEHFQINVTRFSLASLLEELQRFFKEMMASQKNTLIIEVDPAVSISTDRQLLKIVLRNLIDNANKYTKNGVIHIVLETKNGLGRIIVRDNGNGIPLPVLQKLQTRIGQHSKAAILDKDGRLGYQVIIDFINWLEGRFALESSPGKGTSAIISNIVCSLPFIESPVADRN